MSKKQRQKEKRKRNQKWKDQQRAAEKGLEALKRKVQSDAPFGEREVVFQSGSLAKMSDTIMAFVEPYREYATTLDAFERLVSVGVVAWNTALFPHENRQAPLDEISKSIQESAGKEAAEIFGDLVSELIKRKERYFANNRRLIVSYQVTKVGDGFHVAVASMA